MVVIPLAEFILKCLKDVRAIGINRPRLLKVLAFKLSLFNLQIKSTPVEFYWSQSIAVDKVPYFLVLPICAPCGPFDGNVCTTVSCNLTQYFKSLPESVEDHAMLTNLISSRWIHLVDELP